MNSEALKTTEVGGVTVFQQAPDSNQPHSPPVGETLGTGSLGFPAIQHFLSGRPLRRPNRTRPLDRHKGDDDEETRQWLAQSRRTFDRWADENEE